MSKLGGELVRIVMEGIGHCLFEAGTQRRLSKLKWLFDQGNAPGEDILTRGAVILPSFPVLGLRWNRL